MIVQNRAPFLHVNLNGSRNRVGDLVQLPHSSIQARIVGRGTFSAVYKDARNDRVAYICSFYGDESKSVVESARAATLTRHFPHYDIIGTYDTAKHGTMRIYRTQYYGDRMPRHHPFLETWDEAHDKALARAELYNGLTCEQYVHIVNEYMSQWRHFTPSVRNALEAVVQRTVGTEYMFDKATPHNFRLNSQGWVILIDPIFHRGQILQWRTKNERKHKVRQRAK